LRNVVTCGKYSLAKFANFVYFCIACGNCYHFQPKCGNNFRTQYKSIQNWRTLQGYIFRILQPNFAILLILVYALSGNRPILFFARIKNSSIMVIVYSTDLNDNSMSRQVDSPSECGCTHENFDQSFSKQSFNHTTITSQHSCMVDAKPIGKKLPEFFIPGLSNLYRGIAEFKY
jgi:hypothetical protein